jgi:hypothetical protein
MEVGCEDGSWMKLSQDHVHWWALVLMVNLQVNYQRVGWLVVLKFAEDFNVESIVRTLELQI